MTGPAELARRLRMLVQRRRWRRELAEEMRLHRDLRGSDRKFGNDLRLLERSQAQWGWTWLETWLQDTRHGLRLLRRTPLITALALISLALGIGATTALFTLADSVLLRPLPIPHAEQLVQLGTPEAGGLWTYFSVPQWQRIRDLKGVFAGTVASHHFSTANWRGLYVSSNYFNVLGVRAERGRLLNPAAAGCPRVAAISDAFWRSRYGAASGAVGSPLSIAGHTFEIIGISQPGFFGTGVGINYNVAVPLCNEPLLEGANSGPQERYVQIFARLLPGESAAQAQARLEAVLPQLVALLPPDSSAAWRAHFRVTVSGAAHGTSPMGDIYGTALEILLAISGLLWVMTCANLAALLLARAAARRPELATRAALGASRWRLARQMLAESLLLAFGGAVLGVTLAAWACVAIVRFWSSAGYPLQVNLMPDVRMLGVAVGLTLATALLMGAAAAFTAGRTGLSAAARRERPVASVGMRLMAAQLALALVMIAGAGLFSHSLQRLTGPGKGFDASHVLLVKFQYPSSDFARPQHTPPGLLAQLQGLPGVEAAGASVNIPAGRSGIFRARIGGGAVGAAPAITFANLITPGYFGTLRQPLLGGRDFQTSDYGKEVVIINASLAKKLFPRGNALGQSLSAVTDLGTKPDTSPRRVIGIVADAKVVDLRRPESPEAYFPIAAHVLAAPAFYLRSTLPPAVLTSEVRHLVHRTQNLRIQPLADFLDITIQPERMLTWLAAAFGGLALILAGLGLYGVTLYNALRRRREFGIRVALGATGHDIRRQVLHEAGAALATGLVAGGLLAFLLARALRAGLGKLLYEVKAGDAATWTGAVLLLCAIALLASFLPARRAARADAMSALREE